MNIDCIQDSITLPALKIGEKIVIHYAGAYNMTQWMQFIAMRPNVVMVMENGSVELIREAENIEYLMEKERTPNKFLLKKK